jgi:hypothetical protein
MTDFAHGDPEPVLEPLRDDMVMAPFGAVMAI